MANPAKRNKSWSGTHFPEEHYFREKCEKVVIEGLIDYRGDCWKAYLDVGLCLRILPPGESFEFILEKDKLDKIKKVISHNGGEVILETFLDNDVRLSVKKVSQPE